MTSPSTVDQGSALPVSGARVAVVDVRRTVADAVTRLLADQPWVYQATAHTGVPTLAALLAAEPVDAVVADARLCRAVTAAIAAAGAEQRTRVLVVGITGAPEDAVSAVAGGATGWLPSDVTFDELATSLRQVLRGQFWVPGRLLVRSAEDGADVDRSGALDRLTPRELDVLQGMVDGLTRPQIAERLGVSPHTVRTHVHGVLHKLGVHSSLRAVAVAREAGLVAREARRPRSY